MTRKLQLLLIALVLATAAEAATVWQLNLTTGQEPGIVTLTTSNGDPRATPFGTATASLNDAMTALTLNITVNNIDFTGTQTADTNDNLRAAHIHASPTVTPATSAGVVFGFIGAPLNDNNPSDAVVTPFSSGVGGTVFAKWDANEGQNTTLTAQLQNLLSGHAYLNFHTNQNPGGEIRGNFAAVPEPASVLLFGSGLVLIALHRFKR